MNWPAARTRSIAAWISPRSGSSGVTVSNSGTGMARTGGYCPRPRGCASGRAGGQPPRGSARVPTTIPSHVSGDPTGPSDTLEAVDVLDASTAGNLAARGGAVRIASFLAGSLSAVGAAALLYRHLGATGVGQYGLILALIGIVGGFSDLGLTVVGVRSAATLPADERTAMLRDLLGLRVALSDAGITVIALICLPIYPSVIAAGVAIGGIALVVQVWLDNYIVSLIVSLRMGWVAAIQFGNNFAAAIVTVVLVIAGAH